MTTAWAHLPNAVHIDRVLASCEANPQYWANVYASRGAGIIPAWNTMWDIIIAGKVPAAIVNNVVKNQPQSVRDSLVVLIACDECGYMLDSDPGELAILAKFGDPRAILLLTASMVFLKEKEQQCQANSVDVKCHSVYT